MHASKLNSSAPNLYNRALLPPKIIVSLINNPIGELVHSVEKLHDLFCSDNTSKTGKSSCVCTTQNSRVKAPEVDEN